MSGPSKLRRSRRHPHAWDRARCIGSGCPRRRGHVARMKPSRRRRQSGPPSPIARVHILPIPDQNARRFRPSVGGGFARGGACVPPPGGRVSIRARSGCEAAGAYAPVLTVGAPTRIPFERCLPGACLSAPVVRAAKNACPGPSSHSSSSAQAGANDRSGCRASAVASRASGLVEITLRSVRRWMAISGIRVESQVVAPAKQYGAYVRLAIVGRGRPDK